MNGQWIGRYHGSNSGTMLIDLDDRKTHYEGYVYVYDDNLNMPSSFASIKTADRSTPASFELDLLPLDNEGIEIDAKTFDRMYPNIIFSQKAVVTIDYRSGNLEVTWRTDIGNHGEALLISSKASSPSILSPLDAVQNWSEFKHFVTTLEHRRFIFRGQCEPKRLRTCFHRSGRADLHTFLNRDRITLHRHLSQRTKHLFNLDVPDQNGAFFNLLQHHGYPTPLLDWTYSPYIASFFAYRAFNNLDAIRANSDKKVRIFIFDQKEWCSTFKQSKVLTGRPHFSIFEFMAIENERLVPQQSISSVTNIDDIESFIGDNETAEKKFLRVVDLPFSERPQIMRELSTMGITAGSLFPGLDGACEELRERFFQF